MPATTRRDVFHGIADPTRRQILTLVAKEPLNLNTIAEHFEISRPAVSQHIKILAECDLVRIHQHGRERYCTPNAETLSRIAEWIEPFRKLWESRFSHLDDLLNALQTQTKSEP
ncbi:MAG: metalloregulator ArsR/SmtB family transcription factor [Saprospiraceae bacterium]|nr:metalloregulator ArsR/SmtB family transcription factor [Saprospiraceae bacterium]